MREVCACCCRRDGVTTGGCLYCSSRTSCAACGQILGCICGREVEAHACPAVQVVSQVIAVSTVTLVPEGTRGEV